MSTENGNTSLLPDLSKQLQNSRLWLHLAQQIDSGSEGEWPCFLSEKSSHAAPADISDKALENDLETQCSFVSVKA